MSRPQIVKFDFGKASGTSAASKSKKEDKKEPDELILVDAYWEKDSMPIRFIPQQQDPVTLIIVFTFKYDDLEHDKNRAIFELNFEIPGTYYSQEKPFTMNGSKIYRKLKSSDGNCIKAPNGNICYYCEIEKFSSDMAYCSSCIKY